MALPVQLTRDELAKFLPTLRAIRAFESLIQTQNESEAVEIDGQTASASAQQAADSISDLAGLVSFNALAPVAPIENKVYGSFLDTTTQTAALINTAYPITFNTTISAQGVERGTPTSRIYVYRPGIYRISATVQLDKTSAGNGTVTVWGAIDGVAISNSSRHLHVQGATAETVLSLGMAVEIASGSYFELVWSTNSTACILQTISATSPAPLTPSVMLDIHFID